MEGQGRRRGTSQPQPFMPSVQSPTLHVPRGWRLRAGQPKAVAASPGQPLGQLDRGIWQDLCERLSLSKPLRMAGDHLCPREISGPSQVFT